MPQIIELEEYRTCCLPADQLPEPVGRRIWELYSDKITVEPPTFQTEHQWRLRSEGWVGNVPVDENIHILIHPKVELGNLFKMLEYAYKVPFLSDGNLVNADSLQDFYERLAKILALQVLDRSRKGFYREYSARSNRLPYLRGRLALESMVALPWETELDCRYHENTSDIDDNRIPAWTLFCVACSGLCSGDTLQLTRRAFRSIQGAARLKTFSGNDCEERLYSRLNGDYKPMHALCRFFLDHSGPSHAKGDRNMLPFLIDMSRLYETFVAEWLREHLPPEILLKDQAILQLGKEHKIQFRMDLVLLDRHTQAPLCILDTKYKTPRSPNSDDIQQVIAYAKALGCQEAGLVYPQKLEKPFYDTVGGDINVGSATFGLDGDIEDRGQVFLKGLKKRIQSGSIHSED